MDLRLGAQYVLRCHLCEAPVPLLHCDVCQIHLCKACVGDHLSDESKDHKVVPIKQRESTPTCSKHSSKQCVIYCDQCDIPICVQCLYSCEHEQHKKVDILESFQKKKKVLQKDLEELEKSIFPKYQDILSYFRVKKADLNKQSQKLRTEIKKHGGLWQREIHAITKQLTSDIDEMESKNIAVLIKEEDDINRMISEITQIIGDLKTLLELNDINFVFAYESRNAEFNTLPSAPKFSLPSFKPQKIDKVQIYHQFGSLSMLNEYETTMNFEASPSTYQEMPVSKTKLVITNIETEFGEINRLYSVCCQSDQEVWTCSDDHIMRLFNLQGELVKSIETKSGNKPNDIAITKKGYLAFIDYNDQTLNIVKETRIREVRLRRWRPHGVCTTSSGDLLVIMDSDNNRESKVVRYCASKGKEKQSIQFDTNGQPLYSSSDIKHIKENRNLDICVSICWAGAVVVVNKVGKFRFTYNGSPTTATRSYNPYGITTDSQGRILTADCDNHCIHIIDQDGQFLRYIDECGLCFPYGLCVDTKDNLFVAELKSGVVKKIQNYMFPS